MTEVEERLIDLPDNPVPEEVLQALELAFEDKGGDESYLTGMKMAVPGTDRLYGVRVPDLRKLSREILRKYKGDQEALLNIADLCWSQGSREHQLVALFILGGIKLETEERWGLGVRYLPDVNNWESCDQLCHALLGQALAEDAMCIDVLETWLDDENFWIRRAALVSPALLRRAKFSEDLAEDLDRRTLAMAAALLDDKEKYIRKAVDWTVREVIKRHYDLGLDWMMVQASSIPSKTARSTLKLARKKLSKEDRENFLQALEG